MKLPPRDIHRTRDPIIRWVQTASDGKEAEKMEISAPLPNNCLEGHLFQFRPEQSAEAFVLALNP